MKKQHEVEVMPLVLANKIKRWDYDLSVAKMRPLIRQWKKATIEMLRELYLAKEYFANQKGQHKDPDADTYITHTWGGYCGEIGLSYQTANNWLRPFVPRELSDTGKDVLLLEAPMKTDTAASRALMQAQINEVLLTGKRPADWTDEKEAELQKQMKNARLAKIAESCNAPTYFRANDYFSDALKRSKDITNFKLENAVQIQAQYKVFKYIEEYLSAFEDSETQARAAFNIALRTRNYANEYAEKNFQIKNAQNNEEAGDDS